ARRLEIVVMLLPAVAAPLLFLELLVLRRGFALRFHLLPVTRARVLLPALVCLTVDVAILAGIDVVLAGDIGGVTADVGVPAVVGDVRGLAHVGGVSRAGMVDGDLVAPAVVGVEVVEVDVAEVVVGVMSAVAA